MFDSYIHDIQMEISRLQEKKRLFDTVGREIKNFGLEGMDFYHISDECEYMEDKNNIYFEVIKQSYSRGW